MRKKLMIALFSVLAIGIIGNSSTRESKRKVNIKKVDNRKVSEKAVKLENYNGIKKSVFL
jgi:hypothetical protein